MAKADPPRSLGMMVRSPATMTLKSGKASTTLAGLAAGINECWASYSGNVAVANNFFDYKNITVKK